MPYGAQMYFSAATPHQTPNLPQRKGKASVLQSKTKTVPILSSRFVTVRIVVGSQLSTPPSLLSLDQMRVLYRGGLDSNMEQKKNAAPMVTFWLGLSV